MSLLGQTASTIAMSELRPPAPPITIKSRTSRHFGVGYNQTPAPHHSRRDEGPTRQAPGGLGGLTISLNRLKDYLTTLARSGAQGPPGREGKGTWL